MRPRQRGCPPSIASTLFARPGLGHRFIGEQPKILVLSLRTTVDIRNNGAHPLQVIRVVGRTKQLSVRIQSVENFNSADASASEKIRFASNEILAATQIEIGGKNACRRLRPGLGFRTEQRQRDRKNK